MKKLRPASSTLGARKPNTLGTEARIGISTASFVKDVYGEDHNILPLTRGLANRRRPRSGPLRGTLLDPRHSRSSSSKMSTDKRSKTRPLPGKADTSEPDKTNATTRSLKNKSVRGHLYPREMLNPVDDVVDSGMHGNRRGFNRALLRDGMWRELEPLVALKVLRGDSFEEYEDKFIQLQEEACNVNGEDGITSKIVVGFTSKCLIESLNFYTGAPFYVQSIELRISNEKSQMIDVDSSKLYLPNAAGVTKVFAPGMAKQIIVRIFRKGFAKQKLIGTQVAGKQLDNNQHVIDSDKIAPGKNAKTIGENTESTPSIQDDLTSNDGEDDVINTSVDSPVIARVAIEPVQATAKKVVFEGDIDELAESEEDDDGREVFIDEEDAYDSEYGDLITMTVVGFTIHRAPPPAAVVPLLNVSEALRKLQRIGESVEADMLCGLALLRTRRFVQATEIFRRAELNLFDKNAEDAPIETRARRAATFSLLAADGLSHVNQLYFKLIAFHRATEYSLISNHHSGAGNTVDDNALEETCTMKSDTMPHCHPIHPATDVKTGLLSLQPHITNLLLSSLNDRMLPVREAAARGLQFILDHIGCSVGAMFSLILLHLVRVYPVDVDQRQPKHLQRHLPEERAVLLLETCYGMLPYFSRRILSEVVVSVLEPHLIRMGDLSTLNSASTRLSIILLRILKLVIGRLRGDIPLRKGLIVALLTLSEHEISVVCRSARRCWEAVAENITYGVYRSPEEAVEILQWCAEKFSNVNQARPRSARRGFSTLTLKMQDTILYLANATRVVADAVGSLSQSNRQGTNVPDVLMKLIPLLVTRIHKHCFSPEIVAASSFNQSDALSAFSELWNCLIAVARAIPRGLAPSLNMLVLPFLKWAYAQSKLRSPSRSLLGVMRILLREDVISIDENLGTVPDNLDPTPKRFAMDEDLLHATCASVTMESFLRKFLVVFCKWVPHSVMDDTFHVLKAFISLTAKSLTPDIVKIILRALLDRYTVRTKSYMKTIRYFVDVLTVGASFNGSTENEEEIPSISELIQIEKQRLADVETQQQYPNSASVASNIGIAMDGTSSLKVDLNAKCFAFVVGFCTSMSNNYDSEQMNLKGSKYHKNSKSHDFRSSLLHGDETEERLSFLFLCLLALRDKCPEERRISCVRCLWDALTKISTYCTNLLDHPRAEVQHLAFHIMDLVSASLVQNSPDVPSRMKLSHFLFLFLLKALNQSQEAPRPAALRLRCAFFVHSLLYRYMPFIDTANNIEELKSPSIIHVAREEIFGDSNSENTLYGPLPKAYNDRRFAYAIILWERIAGAVDSPWKNLRSVALWVLGEIAEVVVSSITSTNNQDENIRWYTSHFCGAISNVLKSLLDDDWECRLTVVRMLASCINHKNKSIIPDSKIKHMLSLTCTDWHPDVKSASNDLMNSFRPYDKADMKTEGENGETQSENNRLGASPAAHFKGLWEDHEQAFAEQLESLEDFVRGGGKTKWGSVLTPPILSNRLFDSSVAVVPAPPEQAFLDSFLAKTDGQFSENEDDIVDIDGGIVDDDDVPDEVELVSSDGAKSLDSSSITGNSNPVLVRSGIPIHGVQEREPSPVDSSDEDDEHEVELEEEEEEDEPDAHVMSLGRDVDEEEILDDDTEGRQNIIDNDEDRYGDISGEDYYYSEDSNIVYEGEGEGEVAVHVDRSEFYDGERVPFPPKSQRPRSAPATAKRLTKHKNDNLNAHVEQSSIDGFVFDDDSTASDELFGESDEDHIPVLRQHVYKQRESLQTNRQQRPTASSRTQRRYYKMRYNVDGSHYAFIDDVYNTNPMQAPGGGDQDNMLLENVTTVDNNYYQSGYYQPQRNFVGDTWGEQDQHTYTVNGGMDDFIHSGVDANKVKSPPSSARHISRREYKSDVHPQRDGTVFDLTSNSSRPRVSAKDLRSMLKDAL